MLGVLLATAAVGAVAGALSGAMGPVLSPQPISQLAITTTLRSVL
jgi:hypothetical protein